MLYFQSWSGGKDSTASIILEHIYGFPKSKIIMSEVMFDKKRNISGELPEHIKWVHSTAIPLFRSWGYEVEIVRADRDYLDLFYHIISKSKKDGRNGKYAGFLIGGLCKANSALKTKPISDFYKNTTGNYIQYVGIATDEPERLERLKGTNRVSLLAKYGYTEAMTYNLCNGSEFMDDKGMEMSVNGEKRTKIYYCHPYSSYERGSNENLNKMVRRWYPKGESFMMTSDEEIAALEEWMNEYPREIFDFDTAASRFNEEIMKLTG